MAKKRGRPPSGLYAGKQAVVSTRMRSDTKARLDKASEETRLGLISGNRTPPAPLVR